MAIHRKDLIELETLMVAPVYARPGAMADISKVDLPPSGWIRGWPTGYCMTN